MKEGSMLWCGKFRALILIPGFLASTTAYAQSQMDEVGPLPTALSAEQLQSLTQLTPAAVPEPPPPRARRRLPRPVLPLTPEEVSYREAVERLGVNTHQFVHCDLANGRVRTGVLTEIRDDGFVLKDGIIIDQWIPYTDLRAAPRPVAAVGTRIGHGFKWAAVGVVFIAAVPLFVVLYPLVAVGLVAD
jgi:hypothetical protein